MSKTQNGFVVIGVMVLGGVVTAGFFAALAYKKIIDQETQTLNLKHASYIVEDSIRNTIALKAFSSNTTAAVARTEVINTIRNSVNIRMPIPNSSCGADRPCNVLVESFKFVSNACNLELIKTGALKSEDCAAITDPTAIQNNATRAVLRLMAEYLKPEAGGGAVIERRGAGIKELIVPLPQTVTITERAALGIGNLVCPIDQPIFKGTEIVNVNRGQEIRAKCAAIGVKANSSIACSGAQAANCPVKKTTCNTAQGYWLVGVQSDLSARCERFPAGTGITNPVINLCPDGQVATGFKFNNKFEVSNIKCRAKGGPYDFEK